MTRSLFQSSLETGDADLDLYQYGVRRSGLTHGVVLTRKHVAELVLDLAGYRLEENLADIRLLEPACGTGAFLIPAAERLIRSAQNYNVPAASLHKSIRAFDIDPSHVAASRQALERVLINTSVGKNDARELAESWVCQDDFLLADIRGKFDVVVGNPPYIRIEQLSPSLQAEYRAEYQTLFDRADLYIPFIECGLRMLSKQGTLAFVCTDRWTRNRYGKLLRKLITTQFRMLCYIDCQSTPLFETEVAAYPSIFAIGQGKTDRVPVATLKSGSEKECRSLAHLASHKHSSHDDLVPIVVRDQWFEGSEPWIFGSHEHHDLLRDLESRFDPVFDGDDTKVCIGVATGCDRVFIVDSSTNIEGSRLVPLVMRADIHYGKIFDNNRFVINTFEDDGGVVDLLRYPNLRSYLNENSEAIRNRSVAKKVPRKWFRTIDRVHTKRVTQPKLLIPDIAGSCEVTYDSGNFYPHHNLYYVLSKTWDLEVLGGLLSSKPALFFIWSYAVKMRGGYLRFQAQYIRRIRAPKQSDLSQTLQTAIRSAFRKRDFDKLDSLAMEAYSLQQMPEFPFVDTRSR